VTAAAAPVAQPLVELRGVSFSYAGAAERSLRDIDFCLDAGELVVIMGASGAGKSTLARCLNRAVPSYHSGVLSGEVWIDGVERSAADVAALAGVVALVTQDFEAQLFSTNVALEVAFGLEQLGVPRDEMRSRVAHALEMVGLGGFDRRDPSTLSGGEKQRLSIAAVLAMRPRLIVFDEPTTDLDPQGKREIFGVLRGLRDQGIGIVLIEHEPEACRAADRLVLLHAGRIVADAPPGEVLRRVDQLAAAGVPASDLDRLAEALGYAGRFADAAHAAAEYARRRGVRAPAVEPPRSRDDVIVAATGIEFAYPGGPAVLRGVSAEIRAGELVALVGPNGSGKTTLSKHLNGLLAPTAGAVEVRGRDLVRLGLEDVAVDVAYVFQNPDHQIFAGSVREEVRFAVENLRLPEEEIVARSERAIAAVGLAGFEDADPFALGKGHRQRLAVASLLVLEPRLLILDEPTTGLDVREQREMMTLLGRLRDGGSAVLIITHAPWVVAEWADRCLAMEAGAIIFDGPVREFLADDGILERAEFELPEATRVGRELGIVVRSMDELLALEIYHPGSGI
jgi:energy-coupling factor transport system ATP-binding protein